MANTIGVAPPDSFVGNSDQTARRLLRAASAAGRYLRQRDWRALTFEHTITTVSGTTRYAVPTSPAFHHFKTGTDFDRTLFRGMRGPLTPSQWQYGEAILTVSGGLLQHWRIRTTNASPRATVFDLLDDPAGAYTLAFEYVTHAWAYDGTGSYAADIASDSDVPIFDDYLFETECLWRTLRALGEAYFDEKSEADRASDTLYAQENGQILNMHSRPILNGPPNIPEGSWA